MQTELFNVNNDITPGNDFNQYVNSKWMNKNPIPDDYNRWGSFEILIEETNNRLKDILTQDSLNSDHQKLKDLYNLGMNENKLNLEGLKPLDKYMLNIDKINNLDDFTKYVSSMILYQLSSLKTQQHN